MSGQTAYVLTIPGAPKSVNAGGGGVRTNHFAAAREKKQWQLTYENALLAASVPRGMSYCAVDVVLRWKFRKRRDVENFRYGFVKPFSDAMVSGKWLPDDTDEFFRLASFGFEYPENWEWPSDPRLKAEMFIRLDALYD
jgi:hypothetical protein